MTSIGYAIKMLKEKTGKNEFTMNEVLNPAQTIEKYKKA